jgi:hypothetical protein
VHDLILMGAGLLAGAMNAVAGGGTLVTFPALLVMGLPSIAANATSTIALLPAALGGVYGYRSNVGAVSRWLALFGPVSLLGGLVGGILLVRTPSATFDVMVPFLIFFATVLFMLQSTLSAVIGGRKGVQRRSGAWLTGAAVFQCAVAVYGGYFGAGIGILMLASLGMLGFGDIHEMNALKVMLGFLINVVAAIYFIASGLIVWRAMIPMAVGTIMGGYAGARFAQKIPQSRVRLLITTIGLVISAVMFQKQFG